MRQIAVVFILLSFGCVNYRAEINGDCQKLIQMEIDSMNKKTAAIYKEQDQALKDYQSGKLSYGEYPTC